MVELLSRLCRDEEGATAVEYGLIAAAIAGVIALVVLALGPKVNNGFTKVNNGMP
jgi:pilus assembly protein Flp/PilA